MKHIFIINPAANSGSDKKELEDRINALNVETEIYKTKGEKDATAFVSSCIKENGDDVRFYACGGDGIANEVMNGLVNTNAEFAVIPCGTGNDFVKAFGGADKFTLENVVNGEKRKIDCIKIGDTYCVNVCNFGFDAIVGKTANEMKLKGSKDPYGKGIRKAIFTGMHNKISVEADGELLNESGKMLLCTLANGQYVGGQFFCAPKSEPDDGLIDVCLVKVISLFKFLSILKPYTNGEHLGDPRFANIMKYRRAEKVRMYSDKEFYICVDGEMYSGKEFVAEIVPKSVNFIQPVARG